MASAIDGHVLLEEVVAAVDAAETDEKFQNAVFKYLPQVLPILSSQVDGIRKKVMEILLHISKRIKSQANVQLPVKALLDIFKDPESGSFVTNFSLNYIKMGYPRLPIEERSQLVPCLLDALEGKPQSHQDGILMLIMPVLGKVDISSDPDKNLNHFGLQEKPVIKKALTSFTLDILLLPYGITSASVRSLQRNRSSTQRHTSASSNPPACGYPPPGMSEYSLRRVIGENALSEEELEQTKLGVLSFLSSGVLPVDDIIPHLIVGSADPVQSVSHSACFVLSSVIRKVKFNTPSVVEPLYQLYLGTARDRSSVPNASSQLSSSPRNASSVGQSSCLSCSSFNLPAPSALPPSPNKTELQTTPADYRLRMCLLPYICRSQGSGIIYPDCLQIVYDSLYSSDSNLKLKFIALEFVIVIICDSSSEKLHAVGCVLLSCLLKLIAVEGMEVKLLAYLAVGELGVRMPSLVNKDLALLLTFFEALDKETAEVKIAIRDCLLTLMDAFKDLTEGPQRNKLETHLAILVERASEPMARMLAVNYAATLFPPDHAMSRFILLMATGDRQKEVALEAGRALYGFDVEIKSDSDGKQFLTVPNFLRMNLCLSLIAEARMQSNAQRHQASNPTVPFPLLIMKEMLIYLRLCLLREVKIPATRTISYHPRHTVPKIRDFLSDLLYNEDADVNTNPKCCGALDKYLQLIQQYLRANPEFIVLCCLLDLVGSLPDYFASKFSSNLKWLESFVFSSSEEIREVSSIIYGFVVAHALDDGDFDQTVSNLLRQIGKKNIEIQHGCILTIGYCLERRMYMKKQHETKLDLNSGVLLSRSTYKKGTKAIVPFLDHTNPMLVTAACTAIGILGRCAPLPLPDGEADDSRQDGSSARGNHQLTSKLDVVEKLGAVMVNPAYLTKEGMKVKVEAVKAAGYLCVGENFPHRQLIIKKLFDLAQVQVNVRMEKTMTCCILGPLSFASSDPWKFCKDSKGVVECCPKDETCKQVGTWILDEILLRVNSDPCVDRRKAWIRWIPVLLRCCTCEREMTKHLEKGILDLVDLQLEKNSTTSMPPTLLRPVGSTPSISEHPAPLPLQPLPTAWNPGLKLPPQKPVLKLSKVVNGVVLSWNVNLTPNHEEIEKYQLYAYQESNLPPSTSMWKKVGDVKPLKLPMACTLSQFAEGHTYHFAIRAVDIHARIGPFSKPLSILV